MESPHAAAATPTTSKNQSGGAPALCEGKGGRERLRLNGEVGQVEADGTILKGEGRRRRAEGRI